MSIKITNKDVNDVRVLGIAGRITIGEETEQFRESIRGTVNDGKNRILLNLADVSYIDSTALGEFISCFTHVKNNGGQLKLLNLTKKVHELLVITKLITVFEVYDDEGRAVESFGAA
ncbi:MAG: STAS domain-containing protein [Acidobacteria bacterium]|nr:STAS domain-containing protein [Acidobacteriota bacterium]